MSSLVLCAWSVLLVRNIFSRGFTEQFSREEFVVRKRLFKKRAEYELKDQWEEPILGRFYEHELIKAAWTKPTR